MLFSVEQQIIWLVNMKNSEIWYIRKINGNFPYYSPDAANFTGCCRRAVVDRTIARQNDHPQGAIPRGYFLCGNYCIMELHSKCVKSVMKRYTAFSVKKTIFLSCKL